MFDTTDLNQLLAELDRFQASLSQTNHLSHAAVIQAVTSVICGYFQSFNLQAEEIKSQLSSKHSKKKTRKAKLRKPMLGCSTLTK